VRGNCLGPIDSELATSDCLPADARSALEELRAAL